MLNSDPEHEIPADDGSVVPTRADVDCAASSARPAAEAADDAPPALPDAAPALPGAAPSPVDGFCGAPVVAPRPSKANSLRLKFHHKDAIRVVNVARDANVSFVARGAGDNTNGRRRDASSRGGGGIFREDA